MFKLIRKTSANTKNDILSGLTVALALVPEAVAFAFVAGVDPLVGLYGAFMMGIITSIFGGRPGMISGATGAMAVVMVSLVKIGEDQGGHGLEYLLLTLLLVGIIQILAGVLKLGKFVRLLPHSVMMGFVNGLAIVIFLSQLGMFKTTDRDHYGQPKIVSVSKEKVYSINDDEVIDIASGQTLYSLFNNQLIDPNTTEAKYELKEDQVFSLKTKKVAYNIEDNRIYKIESAGISKSWLPTSQLLMMLLLVGLTMGIMIFLPKLTKKIPAALTAIIIVACITIFGGMDVSTVGSFIKEGGGAGLNGGLPTFHSETFTEIPLTFETFNTILPFALILAAIGLIESLMTLNLVDELTETRGNGNRECIAQGGANFINGLFGGMGGCAMIGQSIININSGGRGRLSGVVAAVTLLIFILFGAGVIEQVPIAALVGVMFMVVIGTFAWSSFRIISKIPRSDAFVLILVSSMTVFFDLAIAVICGVIVSALVFSWENAKRIRARKTTREDGTKVYEIWGPLFFGSVQAFNNKFTIAQDPVKIEVDFIESKVTDHSGIEAIKNLVDRYEKTGKSITLKHLSPQCVRLLTKTNPHLDEIIERDIDDPRYFVLAEQDETLLGEV
ncbi:SulP family inorganic anion transporter [Crocinitomicaceae bacterium]|nr:SulP family inorganic anion transporter [Crocinitomicaceae bacterium]